MSDLIGLRGPSSLRGMIMKFVTVLLAAAGFGLSLWSAQAFQETTIGSDNVVSKPAAANVRAPAGLDILTPPQRATSEKSEGVGISIPGLGRLGMLPKMDFGLELLYGGGDEHEPAANLQDAPLDDLAIRGSVKHNF